MIFLQQINADSEELAGQPLERLNGAILRDRKLSLVQPDRVQSGTIRGELQGVENPGKEALQNIGLLLGVQYLVTGAG